ncbi:MAG: hypothetical protein M3P16_00650 [Chloroflexota bacterium]|nr:hypothetical protein [Chloroflexota bacterium]
MQDGADQVHRVRSCYEARATTRILAGLVDGHVWKATPGVRYDDLFAKWIVEHSAPI